MEEKAVVDIKALAKEVAIEMTRRTGFAMSMSDVALFLGYDPQSGALTKILNDPTFPRATSLTPGGRRRWARPQVEAWARSKFEEQGEAILSQMR